MKLQLGILFAVFLVSKSETNCTRNGFPCLDYEILETANGYEKRLYPEATLVSITGSATNRRSILRPLILYLYRYIGGLNENGTAVERIIPVRTLKQASTTGGYNNYTISFYLGNSNPPKPIEDRVFLHKEPATVYAVRSFGNIVRDEWVWESEAAILFSLLPTGEIHSPDYYWAAYDPPWKRLNRLNEVWVRIGSTDESQPL